MKINPILVLTAIAVSMLLVACAAPAQPASKAWVEVSCDEFNSNHHINQMLEAQAGETFEVKLCSNPTTGFQWSETPENSDQTVLQQIAHEFIPPEDLAERPPPAGSPGKEVWTFKTLKKGTSTISFEYSRPWEGGEKGEWTCTVNVVVK